MTWWTSERGTPVEPPVNLAEACGSETFCKDDEAIQISPVGVERVRREPTLNAAPVQVVLDGIVDAGGWHPDMLRRQLRSSTML